MGKWLPSRTEKRYQCEWCHTNMVTMQLNWYDQYDVRIDMFFCEPECLRDWAANEAKRYVTVEELAQ